MLLEFLLIRSAVRERRACFWTDISLFLLELCDTKLLHVLLLLCLSKNFFYLGFLSGIFTIHRTVEEEVGGRGIYLTPLYHFHPLHRHLDISQAITAESSPLPGLELGTFEFTAFVFIAITFILLKQPMFISLYS